MGKNNLQKWETVSSEVVYKANKWFKVIVDTVKLPSNRVVNDYYRIESSEYVLIYAKSADGKILVERQYKHGLGKITATFPAGFVDEGETPLHSAQRELLEETGFKAGIWIYMGAYVVDGTRGFGKAHYFIAENLKRVTESKNGDMEEMDISFMSTDELKECILTGDLCLLPCISIMAMATNPMLTKLFFVVENNA